MKLLFLLAAPLFASQSLVMVTGLASHATTPAGAPWNAVSNFRVEGCVTGHVAAASIARLFDSSMSVFFVADTTAMEFRGPGGITGPAVFAVLTNFRYRYQRRVAAATYDLEVWDEDTGTYYHASAVDANPSTVYDWTNKQVTVGSLDTFSLGATASGGAARIYNTVLALNSTLPPRLLTSNFAPLGDWELEGNLTDSSGLGMTIGVTGGSASYVTTPNLAPVISLTSVPSYIRAAFPASLSISGFANNDNPVFGCGIRQASGPRQSAFGSSTTCAPTLTPPIIGQYNLVTTITDAASLSNQASFSVGAVATDSNTVVILPDENINRIIGPMMMNNSWSWYDNRAMAAANLQIAFQTGASPTTLAAWSAPWNVANSHGTIRVDYGVTTVQGTSTQFQTDFCGGPGNTVPVSTTATIAIWYESSDYPGTTSRGFYTVTACTSQTALTINVGFAHEHGTQTGLSYTVIDPTTTGTFWWTNSNTPGNYYDNILAFYALYYRTGLTKYRDAARTLARNFWEGPNYSRGRNYNFNDAAMGGNFIIAGPARGQAPVGLVLWALESGENIWPGIRYLWTYEIYVAYGAASATTPPFNIQIGNLRDNGYALAIVALCAQYDPDGTQRSTCLAAVQGAIDSIWTPLQVTPASTHGNWRSTNASNASFMGSAGTISVAVTNGSRGIVLTGATWSLGTFENGNHPAPNQTAYLWFTNNFNFAEPPGNNNSAGDSTYYCADYVDATHANLTDCNGSPRNYAGTTGNKGLQVGSIPAFGTQPFMQGIVGGQFGSFIRDALLAAGDTTRAAVSLQFAIDSANWLVNNGATDTANHAIWGAVEFLNCIPPSNDLGSCGSTNGFNGEIMKNFSTIYRLTGNAAWKTAGDEYFGAMFCKPTGGWTCAVPGYGTYLDSLDDGALFMDPANPRTNKQFGFYFGYGAGPQWAADRIGGLLPADPLTLRTSGFLRSPAAKIRLTVQAPDGTIAAPVVCSGSTGTAQACAWTGDRRQGNYQLKTEFLTSGDTLIGPGQFQTTYVQ